MNKTSIDWTDHSLNIVSGCNKRCNYCYAHTIAKRLRGRFGYPNDDPFKVTFHPDKLKEPYKLKKPSKIFLCSMGEIFDPDVKEEWLQQILITIRDNPEHTFQILTKQMPKNIEYPRNVWLGITIDGLEPNYIIEHRIWFLSQMDIKIKFISFEPLLRSMPWLDLSGIQWIIIGSKTGKNPFIPPKAWVNNLIYNAGHYNCAVFLKDNLGFERSIREFPNQN